MDHVVYRMICVVALLVSLVVVDAQMTFSDGWGKRSQVPAKESKPRMKLDQCNQAYSQALVLLHEEMMDVFGNYKQCQQEAITLDQS